jgi:hypothetical protein
LKVVVRDDIAVAWGLNRMTAQQDSGGPAENWSRGTRVFQKTDRGWEMIHQHVSFPTDPATGKTRTDLVPIVTNQPSASPASGRSPVRDAGSEPPAFLNPPE